MLTWLNKKFTEWDYFDNWERIVLMVSIICFAIPAIWGTWAYWAEMLTNIPQEASILTTILLLTTFAIIYFLLFGVLGWIWAYASMAVGVLTSTTLLPFIWLYRKICP